MPQRAEVRADELVSPLKFVVRDGAAGAEVDIECEVVPVVLGKRAKPGNDVTVMAELISQCLAKGRQVFLGGLKRHLLVERIALAALGAGLEPPPLSSFQIRTRSWYLMGARRFGRLVLNPVAVGQSGCQVRFEIFSVTPEDRARRRPPPRGLWVSRVCRRCCGRG